MKRLVFSPRLFVRQVQRVFTDKLARTHYCGDVSNHDESKEIQLVGWVANKRQFQNSTFIVLRDISGKVQLIMNEIDVNIESVLFVKGKVIKRPEKMINSKMANGDIEIHVTEYQILNHSNQLPFQYVNAEEDILLKYRYLDLRRPQLQDNLITRSKTTFLIRQYFFENRFTEIETPTLFKSTPEGAREFLVPTRQKGKFYSLTQSPQQYKQLLMVGGMDRYFQIARCYRDESGRADRQPEFTQVDLEMSFVTQEQIIKLIENLLKRIFKEILDVDVPTPFKRLKYQDAMQTYGSDKPDTRFGFQINKLELLLSNFTFLNDSKHVYYIHAKGLGKLTNKQLDQLFGNEAHVKMLKNQVIPQIAVEKDDIVFLGFGNNRDAVLNSLGRIRSRLGHFENPNLTGWDFLWVVDFPLFEENDGVISSTHHPFTSPHEDDLEKLDTDPLSVRGLHYDIVLNGCEIGGGSIRIHDPIVQEKVLTILKSNKQQFSHLFEAFSYGCPPHGGLALGLDRLMSLICKTKSIRDVIAFPKSMNGNEIMTGSPSEVSKEQLDELFLKIKE